MGTNSESRENRELSLSNRVINERSVAETQATGQLGRCFK